MTRNGVRTLKETAQETAPQRYSIEALVWGKKNAWGIQEEDLVNNFRMHTGWETSLGTKEPEGPHFFPSPLSLDTWTPVVISVAPRFPS